MGPSLSEGGDYRAFAEPAWQGRDYRAFAEPRPGTRLSAFAEPARVGTIGPLLRQGRADGDYRYWSWPAAVFKF